MHTRPLITILVPTVVVPHARAQPADWTRTTPQVTARRRGDCPRRPTAAGFAGNGLGVLQGRERWMVENDTRAG